MSASSFVVLYAHKEWEWYTVFIGTSPCFHTWKCDGIRVVFHTTKKQQQKFSVAARWLLIFIHTHTHTIPVCRWEWEWVGARGRWWRWRGPASEDHGREAAWSKHSTWPRGQEQSPTDAADHRGGGGRSRETQLCQAQVEADIVQAHHDCYGEGTCSVLRQSLPAKLFIKTPL